MGVTPNFLNILANISYIIIIFIPKIEDRQDCEVSEWPHGCPECSNTDLNEFNDFRLRTITTKPKCNGTPCPQLKEDCPFMPCINGNYKYI